jgi:hypothetical protein
MISNTGIVARGVLFGEALQILREIVNGVDGIVIARWHAGAAVRALVGIHIELGRFRKLRFILRWVDASDRAGFDAVLIFGTGVNDDVRHWDKPSRLICVQLPCQLAEAGKY